jgi:hypothetical protein
MKVAMTALVAASMLSSTYAFASTAHHEPVGRYAAPHVVLHSNNGNPNGSPDGPTTLSGTGASQFGGTSAGTSGYN